MPSPINQEHFEQLHAYIKQYYPTVKYHVSFSKEFSKRDYSIIPFDMIQPRDINVIVGSKIVVASKDDHIPIGYTLAASQIEGFSAITIYYSNELEID